MTDRREAIAADLRSLADDLKSLFDSATTDPKERSRKERRWSVLYAVFGVVGTQLARRGTAKVWTILTGEQPPMKTAQPTPQQPKREEPVTTSS